MTKYKLRQLKYIAFWQGKRGKQSWLGTEDKLNLKRETEP